MGRGCHQTTIDLAWATAEVTDLLVRCQDRRDWMHAAGHIPILTELGIPMQKSPEKLKIQWREADWDTFLKTLAAELQPICPLTTTEEVDVTTWLLLYRT